MAGYYGPGIYRTECAYYIRESEKMITCEGLEEHTICGTRFRTEQDKFDFQESIAIKIVKGANMVRCWMKVMGTRGEIRRND